MDHTNIPARLLLGGAGALGLGSVLPWVTVGPFSKNGTDGDGALTLILAIVIAIVAWPAIRTSIGRARSVTTSIATALALSICLYDVANISSSENELFEAHVGIGLWIATAGAGAVLVGVINGTKRKVVRFSARWAPDPTGRHKLRYWNGAEWTDHVSDGRALSDDPVAEEQ